MTNPRGMARALAVLAMLVAVTGCASSHRSPRPAATAGATSADRAAARSVLATDASSQQATWYLYSAEYRLTARCMAARGFSYVPPVLGPEPGPQTTTRYALGRGRPATYGVTGTAVPPAQPDQDKPGFTLALDGSSTALGTVVLATGDKYSYGSDGCMAAARAQLYGSVRAYVVAFYLPQTEGDRFTRFTDSDVPYQSALRAWQSCMRSSGYPVANPEDAISSVRQSVRRQAAVAGADTTCDGTSHLRQHTSQALDAFVGALPRQELEQLDEVARGRAGAYRVARLLVTP